MPTLKPSEAQLLQRLLNQDGVLDPDKVDALYGLEPVLEPDPNGSPLEADRMIRCPHCAQSYEVRLDLSGGRSRSLIEDCAICCRPLQIDFRVSTTGALRGLRVSRLDGSDS